MKKKNPDLKAKEIEELIRRVDGYQTRPDKYFCEVLGIKRIWRKPGDLDQYPGQPAIWKLQEDLVRACPRAIAERKAIYVASGHSLGKDYICGGVALWFLQSFRPSIVVETAPTDRQVQDVMFKETRGHWDRKIVNLGGHAYNTPRIEIEKDWYLAGFTTKETKGSADAGGAKFQGFKGKNNICVIVTESQAVEDVVRTQIDAITTSHNVLMIFLGNPTRSRGWFAKGLQDKQKNIVFHFSCLENPNYIERKVVIDGLADYRWVEKMREEWGEDDPRWISRVLGRVPEGLLNVLFSEELFSKMKEKHGKLAPNSTNRGVSLDPSGDGVDDNVLMSGAGGEVLETYKKLKMTPTQNALKAVEMCKKINGHFIVVDCDGLGQRDFAELRSLNEDILGGIRLVPFYGSEPSQHRIQLPDGREKREHGNLRCEAGFTAQQRAKDGLAALNPSSTELKDDLEADEFFEKRGVLWLIDKDDIRASLNRSPGEGDCYKMLQWAFSKNFEDQTSYKNAPISQSEEFWNRVKEDKKKINDEEDEEWTTA